MTGQASSTRCASHFGWENRYLQPDGPHVHVAPHMRPTRPQVHVAPHILGGKTGISHRTGLTYTSRLICNRPGLKYTLRLTFWVGKQVPPTGRASRTHCASYATGQASSTRCASHFEWENRYLQPDRPHVHVAPHMRPSRPQVHVASNILSEKTGISDRTGLRYTPRLIFWVENR